MGFLSGMFSAAVKIALTPVAIVKDVVNIATNEDADATKKLIESSAEDVNESTDDLCDGKML